jgi:hypothetical protein
MSSLLGADETNYTLDLHLYLYEADDVFALLETTFALLHLTVEKQNKVPRSPPRLYFREILCNPPAIVKITS